MIKKIILFLAILILIFYSRLLFSDFIFYYKDFFRYFYPTKFFASNCIKDGIIPLWNPYNFCGMPFLAPLQSQVLYPLSFITYFLPINLGIKLFIVIHIFLAGLFTYFLMQEWRLSRISSLISSIVYIFSGYFISVNDILNILVAITWIPFIFLFFIKALQSLKAKHIILTAVGICLQFLGGEPTTVYATLLALILYAIAKIIIYHDLKIIVIILIIGLIGVGLSAFQSLPFLELVSYSNRACGMSFEEATRWSLSPNELLDLFIPLLSYTMNFQDIQGLIDSIYLGIVPLCLVFIGMWFGRLGRFWALVFFCFILLSLGGHLHLYKWLYTFIPVFNLMQIPVKFFSITTFSASLLAGFGYEYLLRMISYEKLILFLIISIAIFIVLVIIQMKFPLPYLKIEAIFLILLTLLVLLAKRQFISSNFLSLCIILFILTDLFIAGADLNPMVKENFYQQKPMLAKLIEKEDGYCRILLSPSTSRFFYYHSGPIDTKLLLQAHEAMLPNLGLLHKKVFDADGYECIFLNDYNTIMRIITTGTLPQVHQLLNLLNIKYIISREDINSSELKLVEDKKIKIYENHAYFKRAFLVPKAVIIKNREGILRQMLKPDFDPLKEVILEEEIPILKSKAQNLKYQIKIVTYQSNKVIINTSSSTDSILFISDTYYPGWKALIDSKLTKIYRANYIFRAIFLPKGSHEVKFIYSPLSLKIGLTISLFTILILVIITLYKVDKFVVIR